MNRLFVMFVAALLAAGLQSTGAQQNNIQGEKLLASAQHKATIDGDLRGAIEEYEKVVAGAGANRSLAAQALLRIAECYQKLGDAESSKVYERVLRDFADQKEAVEIARAGLGRTETTTALAKMATRRLWTGNDMSYISPVSRDGRYVTFQDADTGDLAIRSLDTGEKRRLTNKGSWAESRDVAATSVLSRDGKQVAYVWFDREATAYDLRIVPVDTRPGVMPRILYGNRPEIQYVTPFDWSPDGRRILAIVTNKDKTNQIAIVSVPDGSLGVIKSLDWRYPWRPSFSPDGQYIAYNFQPRQDSGQRDVFVLAADGSREVAVSDHQADDYLLGWTPDGKSILFASDRTGTTDIWVIGITNGKTHGSPELIKRNVGDIFPMGVSEKGSLYHQVPGGDGDLYTVNLDGATLKPAGAVAAVTERFPGNNAGAAWSRDGRYLAYVSERGLRGQVPPIICIRSIEDGQERELSPALVYVDGYAGVRWGSDGRNLVVAGQDSNGRQGLYRIDVQSGNVTPLAYEAAGTQGLAHAELSPDAKTLFYRRITLHSKTSHIVARTLASGDERELVSVPNTSSPRVALSPDGRQLAFGYTDLETKSTHLVALAIEEGQTRELARSNAQPVGVDAKEDWTIYPPAALLWTPDGRRLIVGRPDGALWSISAQGTDRQYLGAPAKNLLNARMHPSGQQLVFSAGSGSPEIWAIENFLPGDRPSR